MNILKHTPSALHSRSFKVTWLHPWSQCVCVCVCACVRVCVCVQECETWHIQTPSFLPPLLPAEQQEQTGGSRNREEVTRQVRRSNEVNWIRKTEKNELLCNSTSQLPAYEQESQVKHSENSYVQLRECMHVLRWPWLHFNYNLNTLTRHSASRSSGGFQEVRYWTFSDACS